MKNIYKLIFKPAWSKNLVTKITGAALLVAGFAGFNAQGVRTVSHSRTELTRQLREQF